MTSFTEIIFHLAMCLNFLLVLGAMFFLIRSVELAHRKVDRALEEYVELLGLIIRRELLTATGRERALLESALERLTGSPVPKVKA